MKKLLAVTILAMSVVGCSSIPMGDPKQDAALKTFTLPTDKAGIYIYRNESMGGAVKMDVAIDGQALGQTLKKTYLYKEVAPGKHTISSVAENTDTLDIDAKPGTLSYVWQEVKMGVMYARTKLSLMSAEEGKKGVLETELAATK
jgi:Protein of unknown function (DUF2846)